MKIIYVIVIALLLIVPNIVLADRPKYSFSDDIFNDIETFPDDFFSIKHLFEMQSITAKQLNSSYYQPEILPGWDYWCNRTYTPNSTTFGSYGVFIYPSHFTSYNIQKGDILDVSALIYTNWGIQKYQGVRLNISYSDSLSVTVIVPTERNILLYPTAPNFYNGWMQLIELEVYVKETGNYTITISEDSPDQVHENQWQQLYGNNYTSGSSLISQRIPKCVIDLYQKPDISQSDNNKVKPIIPYPFTSMFIILLIVVVLLICFKVIYVKRRSKAKKP